MGFEELIGAIGAEAARQRGEIRERAEAEARAILGAAEAEGARLLAAAPARGAEAARAGAAQIASRARLAARREVLAARHRVVEDALRGLEERLRRLPAAPGHGDLLGLLLEECAAGRPEGPLTVRCRPEDRAALEEQARARGLEIEVEESPLPLGGIDAVSGPEGRIVCRNGFADRLEAARPLLLQEAGRTLFGDADGGGGAP